MRSDNTGIPMKVRKIHAGRFSLWLEQTRRAGKTGKGVKVPCGSCTACCASSLFIHVKPSEKRTIAKIPKKLMFPAPGLPKGNVVLGYNKKGHCPMYIGNKCSIYNCRPKTCRDFDCRIFTATGVSVGKDKVLIAEQIGRWEFALSDKKELREYIALQTAAKFIREHAECFPSGFIPGSVTDQAILAIKVNKFFLKSNRKPGDERKIVRQIIRAIK